MRRPYTFMEIYIYIYQDNKLYCRALKQTILCFGLGLDLHFDNI